MKEIIIKLLATEFSGKLTEQEIEKLIEVPPSDNMGDFSFPCFSLSRLYRKNPTAIAEELSHNLKRPPEIKEIKPISGYLNFFIDKIFMTRTVLKSIDSGLIGRLDRKQNVVIEFSSPNSNKPLHLGHLRNMSVGDSVSRILAFCGNNVTKTSINNDRGVHICKSMLAYDIFGKGKTPEQEGKKSDHFVGDYYVLFSKTAAQDESWNEKALELLRKWESGDKDTVDLWKKMNTWAFDGYQDTYKLFGISFDKEYFESQIYKSGKEIVNEGLEKGIFKKRDDGAVVVDLTEEKLGEKVLLRPDGTSVYIVQDLFLAVLKDNEYHYDRSIYVVGNEQEYHFAVLIAIFRKLGYPIADKMKHLSYGMVELPEGKMKSREGTVVDADELIDETGILAATELRERYKLTEDVVLERSLKIALSAIKYQLLKVDITKNMLFDPKKAISFEGDTGPYLLYSYARAASIIRKAVNIGELIILEPAEQEIRLIKKLSQFSLATAGAYDRLSPSVIANYAFELSQSFNEFYHACQVIGSDTQDFRLHLVKAFKTILKTCLDLLGIEEIEEM